MRMLIVGGGGREHALAWKCAQSNRVEQVFVAPGNAGTAREARVENAAIAADDSAELLAFARERDINLTLIGPEGPLAAGLADQLRAAGLACFGPSAAAARLESSKAFAKAFLKRHRIATADYAVFTEASAARAWIETHGAPIVVKADGLAAGKGVTVAATIAEAHRAVDNCLAGREFGEAGARVVVEERLTGEEVSFICMVDGVRALPLATSQDHKARDDGDRGPNTGGMGAYSPAPLVTAALHQRIMDDIITPTVAGLAADGTPYTGFLYAGLMIGTDGTPRVIEYNCRLGDPEAQPLLRRLKTDLVDLVEAALAGRLDHARTEWDTRTALGVVMAAGGYPHAYRKGDLIQGLDAVDPAVKVFHAGTATNAAGDVLTAGGRVLCVTALGDDTASAQATAYRAVAHIRWPDCYYRRDIGRRAGALS